MARRLRVPLIGGILRAIIFGTLVVGTTVFLMKAVGATDDRECTSARPC